MFHYLECRQDRSQGLVNKKKTINIQKNRPGRSAMQWHCGLRLFFKKYTYSMILMQLYMVCCIETSF